MISTLKNPAQWLVDWFRGQESESGVKVDVHSALSYPPVWYAVSKIAGHVGQLPLNLHRRLDRGSEHAWTHPVYDLLKVEPNRYQAATVFKEQMMLHALLCGNARAAIVRSAGVPKELIPLNPNCTDTCIVDGQKWHIVQCRTDETLANDSSLSSFEGGRYKSFYRIKDEDVFHVPGLGYDGLTGRSLISVARDSIGLGLAAQKATSRSFKNGSRPSVVIEAPRQAFRDDKDAKEFITNFNEYHEGLDNAGRAALMREGMKLTALQVSASDAQWIEQRRFQRQDTALLFLLESILGDDSSVSYNSLEQKNLAYLSNCLMRWLLKWEQEAERKLISRRQRGSLYFKFNTGALLRADYRTTIEALSGAIQSRIISPNEAREKLDMNPYEGGDQYLNPAIEQSATAAEVETTEPMTPENANRNAMVAHLRHMIGVESKRVLHAAGNRKNYIGWLDAFYDSDWCKTIGKSIESLGGDAGLATFHCEQSKTQLIEIAGTVTPDGLADAVSEVIKGWDHRAESLASQILGEKSNV